MFYDVIIIGAGLSGLMAAEAAQSAGARVLVLARGMGSLPLTTGCIDGLGYFPNTAQTPLFSPFSALPQLQNHNPEHPYAKLGSDKILAAFDRFLQMTRLSALDYQGSLASNFILATPLGTLHPTCLVPRTMAAGSLSSPSPVLLLGFAGMKDFSASWAAANLTLLQKGRKTAAPVRAQTLDRLDLSGRALNPLNLAMAFDQNDFRDRFAQRVQPLLRSGERLGLPAVLGFRAPIEAWADLCEKLSVDIFEVPLPPPSVPGIRLFNALREALQRQGARFVIGLSSLRPILERKKILGLALGSSPSSPVYKGKAFVLATGKFMGGGLDSNQEKIFETLFDLPINFPGARRDWFHSSLLTAAGQPFNRFGVEVDHNLQPLDENGNRIYANLFAAGGIIAHADSMTEKSGGGVAVATGVLAGQMAAGLAAG